MVEELDVDPEIVFENIDVLCRNGALSLITSLARVERKDEEYRKLGELTERNIVEKDEEGIVFTDKGREIYEVIKEIKNWNKSGLEGIDNVTVLVGDDDPDAKSLYNRQLSEAEIDFTTTKNEFISKLENPEIDVVLVERMLVDIDNFVGSIRDKHDEIPIIAVTTVKPEKSILKSGVDDYLVKPVGADALRRAVGRSIRARHLPLRLRQMLFLLAQKAELEEQYSRKELKNKKHYRKTVEDLREVSQELLERPDFNKQ